MDAILTRTGDAPVTQAPIRQTQVARRLLRLVSAVALAAADRVTLPYRDVPPEYYRFPWF